MAPPYGVYKVYIVNIVLSTRRVYDVYRGDFVKKTELITYRTDAETKGALAVIAVEKKWSISQLTEEIIKAWLRENRPELLENIQDPS